MVGKETLPPMPEEFLTLQRPQQKHISMIVQSRPWYSWKLGKTTDRAALAKEFFAFGAFGSDTKDLAARRSLLDAVDVFFKFRTRESFAASS